MSTPPGGGRALSIAQTALQVALIGLIFLGWSTPFLQPIKLMVVLLHEMSHGLMALASGGTVYDIVITADEGGACRSGGGNGALIAAAGYLGSMFFGGMILRASRGRAGVPVAFALLTLLLLGAAVTVIHDSYSRTFAMTLAGIFIFLGLIAPIVIGAIGLRVMGTVSCLYAIFDIYSDLLIGGGGGGGRFENDAQTFSNLTGAPVQAVGVAWFLVSVLFFIAILRSSLEVAPAKAAEPAPEGKA
jgi:peptidase M50B-like protein